LVNMAATKGQLGRMDRTSRRGVRSCLHLPKDTPLGYLYAATVDGGLGIPCLETKVPRLREDLLQRLGASGAPAVRHAVSTTGGRTDAATTPAARKRDERDRWSRQLYEAADGRGLRGAHLTPQSSKWIDDGTQLLKGRDYVRAVKLRGNLMGTKTRSARGRRVEDVSCDLCRRRPETLGHVLQRCHVVQDARIHRHNRVLDLLVHRLEAAGFQCRKEPAIPTVAGSRVPDVVAWRQDLGSWVLDVQVVADAAAGDLDTAHQRKVDYYNTDDVRRWVQSTTGFPPAFSTITISWRGILATPTVNTWATLGLRKSDLKVLVVRTLEGSGRIYSEFQRTSGGPGHHPG